MKEHKVSNKNSRESIIKEFDALKDKDKLKFLYNLIDEKQNPELDIFELLEETKEHKDGDYEAIMAFADKYREKHPEIYAESYQFTELMIIENAFYYDRDDIIRRSLSVITQNPVHGIDIVTLKALYMLLYSGRIKEAVEYSNAVWKPLKDSDKLIGSPEIPFLLTLYYEKLEEEYLRQQNGDSSNWENFVKELKDLGFDGEKGRMETTLKSLTDDYTNIYLNDFPDIFNEYVTISLSIYFNRYMKEKYNMSFQISDRLIGIIFYKSLYNKKAKDNMFNFSYNNLEKHIVDHYDSMFGSNHIEMAGKVMGLHYVYEFLHSVHLISEEDYRMMLIKIAMLQKAFLKIAADEIWKLKFNITWPSCEAALLKIPKWVFEKRRYSSYKEANDFIEKAIPDLPEFALINAIESGGKSMGVHRNDPCPCGSGRKFKNCCLKK